MHLREDGFLILCYGNCLDFPICLIILSGSLEDKKTCPSSIFIMRRGGQTLQKSVLNLLAKPANKMAEKAIDSLTMVLS